MGRRAFTDFMQIKNLREGRRDDGGKVVNIYFDLVIGAFTIKGASLHGKSGSIRLNAGRRVSVKGSYIKTIRKMFDKAVIELRKENAKRNVESI